MRNFFIIGCFSLLIASVTCRPDVSHLAGKNTVPENSNKLPRLHNQYLSPTIGSVGSNGRGDIPIELELGDDYEYEKSEINTRQYPWQQQPVYEGSGKLIEQQNTGTGGGGVVFQSEETRSMTTFDNVPGATSVDGRTGGQYTEFSNLRKTIPGEPDVDYPIYREAPATSFDCRGKHNGYYADVEARCQVFRVCANTDLTGRGFAFLCPNGTLFNQEYFVCDWYNNVDCLGSTKYYYKNEEIGKSIGSVTEMIETVRKMIDYTLTTNSIGQQRTTTAPQYSESTSGFSNTQFISKTKSTSDAFSISSAVDSSSSATTSGVAAGYGSIREQQPVYISSLGELSTDDNSGFDISKSKIINQNLDYGQSVINSQKYSPDPRSEERTTFHQSFYGTAQLVTGQFGPPVLSGSFNQGRDIQRSSTPAEPYLPPAQPSVTTSYLPPQITTTAAPKYLPPVTNPPQYLPPQKPTSAPSEYTNSYLPPRTSAPGYLPPVKPTIRPSLRVTPGPITTNIPTLSTISTLPVQQRTPTSFSFAPQIKQQTSKENGFIVQPIQGGNVVEESSTAGLSTVDDLKQIFTYPMSKNMTTSFTMDRDTVTESMTESMTENFLIDIRFDIDETDNGQNTTTTIYKKNMIMETDLQTRSSSNTFDRPDIDDNEDITNQKDDDKEDISKTSYNNNFNNQKNIKDLNDSIKPILYRNNYNNKREELFSENLQKSGSSEVEIDKNLPINNLDISVEHRNDSANKVVRSNDDVLNIAEVEGEVTTTKMSVIEKPSLELLPPFTVAEKVSQMMEIIKNSKGFASMDDTRNIVSNIELKMNPLVPQFTSEKLLEEKQNSSENNNNNNNIGRETSQNSSSDVEYSTIKLQQMKPLDIELRPPFLEPHYKIEESEMTIIEKSTVSEPPEYKIEKTTTQEPSIEFTENATRKLETTVETMTEKSLKMMEKSLELTTGISDKTSVGAENELDTIKQNDREMSIEPMKMGKIETETIENGKTTTDSPHKEIPILALDLLPPFLSEAIQEPLRKDESQFDITDLKSEAITMAHINYDSTTLKVDEATTMAENATESFSEISNETDIIPDVMIPMPSLFLLPPYEKVIKLPTTATETSLEHDILFQYGDNSVEHNQEINDATTSNKLEINIDTTTTPSNIISENMETIIPTTESSFMLLTAPISSTKRMNSNLKQVETNSSNQIFTAEKDIATIKLLLEQMKLNSTETRGNDEAGDEMVTLTRGMSMSFDKSTAPFIDKDEMLLKNEPLEFTTVKMFKEISRPTGDSDKTESPLTSSSASGQHNLMRDDDKSEKNDFLENKTGKDENKNVKAIKFNGRESVTSTPSVDIKEPKVDKISTEKLHQRHQFIPQEPVGFKVFIVNSTKPDDNNDNSTSMPGNANLAKIRMGKIGGFLNNVNDSMLGILKPLPAPFRLKEILSTENYKMNEISKMENNSLTEENKLVDKKYNLTKSSEMSEMLEVQNENINKSKQLNDFRQTFLNSKTTKTNSTRNFHKMERQYNHREMSKANRTKVEHGNFVRLINRTLIVYAKKDKAEETAKSNVNKLNFNMLKIVTPTPTTTVNYFDDVNLPLIEFGAIEFGKRLQNKTKEIDLTYRRPVGFTTYRSTIPETLTTMTTSVTETSTVSATTPITPALEPDVNDQENVLNKTLFNYQVTTQQNSQTSSVLTQPPITPSIDVRFQDDKQPIITPSKLFSLPFTPEELAERGEPVIEDQQHESDSAEAQIVPFVQTQLSSARSPKQTQPVVQASNHFLTIDNTRPQIKSPSNIPIPPFIQSSYPVAIRNNPSRSNLNQPITSYTPSLPKTLPVVTQSFGYQYNQPSSSINQASRPSFAQADKEKVVVEIVPAQSFYLNNDNENKAYFEAVSRGLLNDGFVYVNNIQNAQNVRPALPSNAYLPQSQRIQPIPIPAGLSQTNAFQGTSNFANGNGNQPIPSARSQVDRRVQKEDDATIFKGFSSYSVPLSSIGKLPSDSTSVDESGKPANESQTKPPPLGISSLRNQQSNSPIFRRKRKAIEN